MGLTGRGWSLDWAGVVWEGGLVCGGQGWICVCVCEVVLEGLAGWGWLGGFGWVGWLCEVISVGWFGWGWFR